MLADNVMFEYNSVLSHFKESVSHPNQVIKFPSFCPHISLQDACQQNYLQEHYTTYQNMQQPRGAHKQETSC